MVFPYKPLRPNHIRLLKRRLEGSGPLSFDLVHVSLTSKPRYAALSYTWGPPGDTDVVLLDSQHFPVRPNLHDALQRVYSGKSVDRYLWVDAICIHQGSDETALNERSVQITLMKQIYEQAATVWVWLGNPENEENNRLAFATMRYFHEQGHALQKKAHPYQPWWWPNAPRTIGQDFADMMLTFSPATDRSLFDAPGSRTHRAWLGIISLWNSRWWARTWIYQESTLADKPNYFIAVGVPKFLPTVRFMCGDQETSWLELAATHLVAIAIVSTPGVDSQFLQRSFDRFSKLATFRQYRTHHSLRSLLEVLQQFRHTECSPPSNVVHVLPIRPLATALGDSAVRRKEIDKRQGQTIHYPHDKGEVK